MNVKKSLLSIGIIYTVFSISIAESPCPKNGAISCEAIHPSDASEDCGLYFTMSNSGGSGWLCEPDGEGDCEPSSTAACTYVDNCPPPGSWSDTCNQASFLCSSGWLNANCYTSKDNLDNNVDAINSSLDVSNNTKDVYNCLGKLTIGNCQS